MAAGDTLARTDASVEAVIRRIERAFGEVSAGEALQVEGTNPTSYVQNFRWASAKYQANRAIDELVKVVTQSIQRIDEELKEAATAYQESKHELNALQRKKGGNLMANLREYIKNVDPQVFLDTEYLTTMAVIVPQNNEQRFLSEYEQLADDAVGYGPPDDRQSVLGSPVVPGSANLVTQDNDGYVLYAVTILKLFKEDFTQACQKAKFTARDVVGGESQQNDDGEEEEDISPEAKFARAEIEFEEAKNQLKRWAQTHFGEAFVAWIHIKTIRVFVEAVLLYGLPVDFVAALVLPKRQSNEEKIRSNLAKLYGNLTGDDMVGGDLTTAELPNMPGASSEYFPYVSFTFKPIASD